jgi:Mg-chelatase subunit ChlD
MMTGRHVSKARATRPTRSRLIIGLAVLATAAAIASVVAVVVGGSNSPSAASSKSCTSGVALTVVAAPAIAPTINDVASHWMNDRPVVDGACPTVVVRTSSASSAESTLAKPDVTMPDVWIPDSSLWVRRLREDTAGVDSPAQSLWTYPSIASSPLVLATTSSHAKVLAGPAAQGWGAAMSSSQAVSMVDPNTTTEGLLALLTTQSLVDGSADTPSRQLISAFVDLAHDVLPSTDAGFLALSKNQAQAFPASEQGVLAADTAAGNPMAVAVYPSGKSMSLDFPVVQVSPPGGDPARRDAAVAFIDQLSQAYAQQRMRTAGLRDVAGNPLAAKDPSLGVEARTVSALAAPTADHQSDGLRAWTAAGRGNRTLTVIDLSGSMSEVIGGGDSKIKFAAEAEKAAVDFFPDSSSLGLWGFSVNRTPTTDWTQLVPLGPLGSQVGGKTRRQALTAAAANLPNLTGGETGLYKTTLAAYEAVRSGYDPSEVNSVVLLTDGANTDTNGIDLPTLLSQLRSESNRSRPLPIITIAVGEDADVNTLKQISAATGGKTYTVSEPGDIRGAFLDAIIKAG